jgi:hypothetical protein
MSLVFFFFLVLPLVLYQWFELSSGKIIKVEKVKEQTFSCIHYYSSQILLVSFLFLYLPLVISLNIGALKLMVEIRLVSIIKHGISLSCLCLFFFLLFCFWKSVFYLHEVYCNCTKVLNCKLTFLTFQNKLYSPPYNLTFLH